MSRYVNADEMIKDTEYTVKALKELKGEDCDAIQITGIIKYLNESASEGVFIEGAKIPAECRGCFAEDKFTGGCNILNSMGGGVGYIEFDDEWHKAHKEHRRMKWCPLN